MTAICCESINKMSFSLPAEDLSDPNCLTNVIQLMLISPKKGDQTVLKKLIR